MTILVLNLVELQAWALDLLPWAGFFALALVLDLVGGALLDHYRGEFSFEELPKVLEKGILYFWAWVTVEVFAFAPLFFGIEPAGWLESIADIGPKVVFGLIVAGKYGASIVKNVRYVLDEIRHVDAADEQLVG